MIGSSVCQQFDALFEDMAGNYKPGRHHHIDWVHVAMNRVLWSCVVSLGDVDC